MSAEELRFFDRFREKPLKVLAVSVFSFVSIRILESFFEVPIQEFFATHVWGSHFFITYGLPLLMGIVLPLALIILLLYVLFRKEGIVSHGHSAPRTTPDTSFIQTDSIPPPQFVQEREIELSGDAGFHKYISQEMEKASSIILIGIGLNVLHNDVIRKGVMDRARAGRCRLEIYLANPLSPSIEDRLIEEETGDEKPTVGRDNLIIRLNGLLDDLKRYHHPDTISLKLFSNYPGFALIIVDDNYFFYPYAFTKLGNHSPVFQFSRTEASHQKVISFLDRHNEMIRDSAKDAREFFELESDESRKAILSRDHSFALYFVPSCNSDLYKFGTEILGYDIHRKKEVSTKWLDMVGNARHYGFHLTLADVLYFQNAYEVKRAIKETAFLTNDIHHFDIGDFRVKADFPAKNCLSLVPVDLEGGLELLHHELVQRVYRRACGTNYSFELETADRAGISGSKRTELMINRYFAPYILNAFKPHFTLLTRVPPNQMESVKNEIEALFNISVKTKHAKVDKVAVMAYDNYHKRWKIEEEFPLK